MLTTKAQKAKVTRDLWKINSSVESLELVKLKQPKVVANLSKECRCSEMELQTIKQNIATTKKNAKIGKWS
jgi:SMC interacting uncharacterized protein involved in chromosome segregation